MNVNVQVCKFTEAALEQYGLSLSGDQCGFSLVLKFRGNFPSVMVAYYLGKHLCFLFFKGCFKTHDLKVILQKRNAGFPLPVKRHFIYRRSGKKYH